MKIPNAIGVFSRLESVGAVTYKVSFDPDEFQDAFNSSCSERGCLECKYFSSKDNTCHCPPLFIHFKSFEK